MFYTINEDKKQLLLSEYYIKNGHKQHFGMTLELKHHVFFEDYNYKDYSKYYVKDSLGNIHRLW